MQFVIKSPFSLLLFLSLWVNYQARGQANTPVGDQPPNIIFILTDDLGYGDLGVLYQNQRKKNQDPTKPWASTPHLDALANDGAVLLQHYAAAPVCAPSRASLLSGLSQGHANVRNNQFDKALADNYTLANTLQKAGYATAAIGKWGLQGDRKWSANGASWPAKPTNRGFDYFYGYMKHIDGHEHYPKDQLHRKNSVVWENDTDVTEGLDKCYTADLWTAAAKHWIAQLVRQSNQPFFLFLAYDTPHAVLQLPTQPYPTGGGVHGGVQWLGTPGKMINTASGAPDSWVHPDYASAIYDDDKDPTTAPVPWPLTYQRYATSVRRIDDAVGDIMQLLKDLNVDDNTLIIFTSDNGPSEESYLPKPYVPNHPDFFDSFGPFDGIKRDLLEGGLRMPLLARWPAKIAKGTVDNTPSISYDWLPTLLAAAGLPAPANSDGVSLLPALTKTPGQKDSKIYVEYFHQHQSPNYFATQKNRNRQRGEMQMIRLQNYVGLRYNIQDPTADFEIYDIITDTYQANNLAANGALPDLQEAMKRRYLQMRRADTSAVRPYDSELIPSVAVQEVKKGVQWAAYQGAFPWLPNLETLKAERVGKAKNYTKLNYQQGANNLYLLTGYLKVPKDGTYTFSFSAAEKGLLRLHDATLFDADYGYQPGTPLTTSIKLQKGLHPVRIYLQNSTGHSRPFSLSWQVEGMVQRPVPATAFYR